MTSGVAWPRRGEVWWAFLPGQPDDPHQPRPVLVVSLDVRNRYADDLIVVPFLSRGRPSPTRLLMLRGTGGLPNDSILFCDEIATISRRFLSSGPLGPPVPNALLDRVVARVMNAIAP